MTKRKLSARQLLVVQVSERTMSVLSILGSLFIMGTFIRWHFFRKPINRLVFYASFGNVMANVATLISTSAIPAEGEEPSGLCQFQGVLIQWFLMADSLWVFCMALNVMLVFFQSYNSRQLRRLEKWYLGFAYGIPFLTAFVYIVVEKTTHKRIYGPATIWCWVDSRVEWMRIAFFYAPVWIVVCLTLGIYLYTGYTIFRRRRNLKQLSRQSTSAPTHALANPFTAAVNVIERTTEISVRYTLDSGKPNCSKLVGSSCGNDSRSSFSSTRQLSSPDAQQLPTAATPITTITPDQAPPPPSYRAAVTVPGENKSALVDTTARPRSLSVTYDPNNRRNLALEGNTAAWSYFKVAFLMFAALIIVWVPSTVNRLQQFIHRDSPIFALNLASALVLPLQGFWNSMVYVSTTWPECNRAVQEVMDAIAKKKHYRGSAPVGKAQRKDSENTMVGEGEGEGSIDMLQVMRDDTLERGANRAHAAQMEREG